MNFLSPCNGPLHDPDSGIWLASLMSGLSKRIIRHSFICIYLLLLLLFLGIINLNMTPTSTVLSLLAPRRKGR